MTDKSPVLKLITSVWTKFFVPALLGIALIWAASYWAESLHPVCEEVIKHIGVAILVATIVALLFHIREIEEHFQRFAKVVLVDSEYLGTLNSQTLLGLRSKIASVVLDKVVSNKGYAHDEIDKEFEKLLFGKLLPSMGQKGGEYRHEYHETVQFEFMTAPTLGYSVNKAVPPNDHLYVKIVTTTDFEVVSPRTDSGEFSLPCEGTLIAIDFLGADAQAEYEFGVAGGPLQKVTLDFPPSAGLLRYSYVHKVTFAPDGRLRIRTRCVEIDRADVTPFMLKRMELMTKTPNVVLNSNVDSNLLNVFMLGFAHDFDVPCDGVPTKVRTINYPGWMAPSHGYLVFWNPDEIRLALQGGSQSATSGQGAVSRVPPSNPAK